MVTIFRECRIYLLKRSKLFERFVSKVFSVRGAQGIHWGNFRFCFECIGGKFSKFGNVALCDL